MKKIDFKVQMSDAEIQQILNKNRLKEEQMINEYQINQVKNFYYEHSLVSDESVFKNCFKKLEPINQTFRKNANFVKNFSKDFANGKKYNVILQGNAGTGKTMLATAMLADLSNQEIPCLMIDCVELRRLALANNQYEDIQAHDDYNYMIENLHKAKIVLLDDLGSETSMNTNNIKTSNETIQRALFEITSITQNKVLIITTNYNAEQLGNMYNTKILSRFLTTNTNHILNFDKIPDYRVQHH